MFDFAPEDYREWENEPTKNEVLYITKEMQREIIKKYDLPFTDEVTVIKPLPLAKCTTQAQYQHNQIWKNARLCLEVTIYTAKELIPERYEHLFDVLPFYWMPEIQ